MTSPVRSKSALVDHLERLAARDDRAALASLRSSFAGDGRLDALRIVLPFLGPDAGVRREDDAALIAGLFGLSPMSGSVSLAGALRRTQRETGSDSVEGRFRALLNAGRGDLGVHLRYAVSLVGSRGIGIDWDDVYRAVRYWDHDDDFVRRGWARDFWASGGPGSIEADDAGEFTSTEG